MRDVCCSSSLSSTPCRRQILRLDVNCELDLVDADWPWPLLQVSCGWKHNAAVGRHGQLLTWGWGGSQGSQSFYETR